MNRNRFLQSLGLVSGGLVLGKSGGAVASPADFSRVLAATSDDQECWKKIREQFMYPEDYIYFNTGGIGAMPKPVLAMIDKKIRDLEMAPRPGHDQGQWQEIKRKVSPFVGPDVQPEEIALVSTATEGINIILNGLKLKAGDEVITTTHEHVAMNVPLLNHIRNSGIVVKSFIPDTRSGLSNVENIRSLINNQTRLIMLSHITCTTGQILPVSEIGKLATERGILFAVDGAQSTGTMPINVKAWGIDFYATCGHKWMLGPKRTGMLYIRRDRQDLVLPTTVGAYSDLSHDLEKGELKLHDTAERYEFGTQNEVLFHGLETAAEFLSAIGLEKIRTHNRLLAEKFYQGLLLIPGVDILSPAEEQYRSSMITFRPKTKGYQEVANYLTGVKRIRVRVVPEAGLNAVRASFHVYNQEFEVERLLEEIGKYVG